MAVPEKIEIYNHLIPLKPVAGNTPFGYYDNDPVFIKDAQNFVKFAAQRLGYPIVDIELQDIQFYACYEQAVSEYGEQLYEYKIRENYLSMEGATTGSTSINNSLINPNLGNIIRIAEAYAAEAGAGGNVNYYSGSLWMTANQQFYDLNVWASQSASLQPGDSIEIKKVFYEAPPAITRYFDPYAGTGTGFQSLMDTFGFGTYSPAINFMLMPIYYDVQVIQAIEFNDQIRRSAFTFDIQNNRIRIFPIPTFDGYLWFTYIKKSERNSTTVAGDPQNLITDISKVPYINPVYSSLNFPTIQWIRSYALALVKETLGNIRNKYSTIPIPNSEVTLNGQSLIDQGQKEMDALIEKLKDLLAETSRDKQLEKKKLEDDNLKDTLSNVPNPIFIF